MGRGKSALVRKVGFPYEAKPQGSGWSKRAKLNRTLGIKGKTWQI